MDIKKQESETSLQHHKRLVYGKLVDKTLADEDYTELAKEAYGKELSSDVCRRMMYGSRITLDLLEQEHIDNISDDAILKEYEIKKQELEKEKIKVQTEKLSLNQALREQARFELFIEQAITAIKETKPIQINTEIIIDNYNKTNESGLLIFADPHYGKEFKINGLYGEVLNEYSIEIFEKRMWKLLDKAVRIIKKEGFNRISLFNLGDELEGILRISQLMTLKLGLVDASIAFAYFIANWLNELSKYVLIDYYSTEGNHTDVRLLTGKKGDFPHENMSRVIQALVSEILKDNTNITIHKNNTDKIFVNIEGFNVLGIHGEEKNLMQAIRDFSFIYNTQIDYLCTGHKHHANTINAGVKKGCIGVGSIIGIDDYSMELKRTSNPSATFVVFENGVGKTQEYTIYLD